MKTKSKLFLFSTDQFDKTLLSGLEMQLSSADRAEHANFQSVERKQNFILTRNLISTILKKYFGLTHFVLHKTESGKPYLVDGPSFNLSHTDGFIAILMNSGTQALVGVDVEKEDPSRDVDSIIRHYGSASDRDYFAISADSDKRTQFYKIWTMKEAFGKAMGRGLNANLQEMQILFHDAKFFHPELREQMFLGHFQTDSYHFGICTSSLADQSLDLDVMQGNWVDGHWKFSIIKPKIGWITSKQGEI